MASSVSNSIRIYSPQFDQIVSEVKTVCPVSAASIDAYSTKVALFHLNGSIGVLNLETQNFETISRTHQENIDDITYLPAHRMLASCSGKEFSVKTWDDSNNQLFEFITDNDEPLVLDSMPNQPIIAVGYKSGYVRVFDCLKNTTILETLIYHSPVKCVRFSPDELKLAVMNENSRIIIFDCENEFSVIKTIDYDFPNNNYFSIDFSRDGRLLANISTNANTITIWETDNFTLKYQLDLTGNIISKLQFAPNSKDLVVMTVTSKLKFFRIGNSEVTEFREIPNINNFECLDFKISPNNKYLITAGKDGLLKVYDYYFRGTKLTPSY